MKWVCESVQRAFLEAEVRCPRRFIPRFVIHAPMARVCFRSTAKTSSGGW